VTLFARLTDAKDGFAVFRAKNLGDIFGICQSDRRVVVGHSFYCDGYIFRRSALQPNGILRAGWVRTAIQHQGGHDRQVGIERVLVEVLPQAWAEAFAVELAGIVGVDGSQLEVCHQAIKAQAAAIHHHKRPFLHRLCRHGQLHLQVGFKTAPCHKADRWVGITKICLWFHDHLLQFRKRVQHLGQARVVIS